MATTGWSVEDRENFYQSGWLLSQNCKVIILILLLFFPLSRTTVSIDINITESWCANTTTVQCQCATLTHYNIKQQTCQIIFLHQKTININFPFNLKISLSDLLYLRKFYIKIILMLAFHIKLSKGRKCIRTKTLTG